MAFFIEDLKISNSFLKNIDIVIMYSYRIDHLTSWERYLVHLIKLQMIKYDSILMLKTEKQMSDEMAIIIWHKVLWVDDFSFLSINL
jgi:hypothetical protein